MNVTFGPSGTQISVSDLDLMVAAMPGWILLDRARHRMVERVVRLAVEQPGVPRVEVPATYARPFVDWLARVDAVCKSDLGDVALLGALEALRGELPGLAAVMDVQALAETMTAGMEKAAAKGVDEAIAKLPPDGVTAFAVGVEIGPLPAAVERMARKIPVVADRTSYELSAMPLAIRERGQFSAHVASSRFLSEVSSQMGSRLSLERELLANGKSAFVDRGSFILHMQSVAEQEGIDTTNGDPALRGTIRDIRSASRLGLIWDMQNQMSNEYARWTVDHDPDVLDVFPAQRLGESTAEHPRGAAWWMARWDSAGNETGWRGALRHDMVALKTSPIWTALSTFGVPWPPFDWGSTRMLDDVDRAEAERLGLIEPRQPVPAFAEDGGSGRLGFNARLEASVEGVKPEMRTWLADALGGAAEIVGDIIRWVR